jgi:uncharacterized protein (DUF433 family)
MATNEVFTYYRPDGRIEVREGELHADGAAWIDGSYPPPLFPSAVNVRVGKTGIAVATIIAYLRAADGDVEKVLAQWSPLLERQDIEMAMWFYNHTEADKREIDARLEGSLSG